MMWPDLEVAATPFTRAVDCGGLAADADVQVLAEIMTGSMFATEFSAATTPASRTRSRRPRPARHREIMSGSRPRAAKGMVVTRDKEERPGDAHAGTGAENFTGDPPKITGSPWISGATSPGQPAQPGKQRIISLSAQDDPANSSQFTLGQLGSQLPASAVLPTEVTVYTAADDGEDLRDAVVDVLELCGFEIVLRMEPERGSWFQRLLLFRRDSRAADKLVEVLQKVERAAELKHIAAPRSESDEREANAVARLAEATGGHDEVVVRLSSVLYVKSGGRVIARVLTEDEIRVLDENPQLMRSPVEILDGLSQLRETAGLPPAAAREDTG
jgi:hypothetical protein